VRGTWLQTALAAVATLAVALLAAHCSPDGIVDAPFRPRSVAAHEACRNEAQARYPGDVVRESSRIADGQMRIRITISLKDESEVVVVCDGLTGHALRAMPVDDEPSARDGLK
jgi:hypothetical protein